MRDPRIMGQKPPAESPEARTKREAILDQARLERRERFPVLTDENADDAMAWQEARIAELSAK